jgi:chemotaxis protein MotB
VADEKPSIFIRKVKKGGHGAHGGSWKVAYADFMTAMMAFFLLMWLLSMVDPVKK